MLIRTTSFEFVAYDNDMDALHDMSLGRTVYTNCASGLLGKKVVSDVAHLVNNCMNWCTIFRKVNIFDWCGGEWEEGAMYLCYNDQGLCSLKFYSDGLLWDSLNANGHYHGNNLLDHFVSAKQLTEKGD